MERQPYNPAETPPPHQISAERRSPFGVLRDWIKYREVSQTDLGEKPTETPEVAEKPSKKDKLLRFLKGHFASLVAKESVTETEKPEKELSPSSIVFPNLPASEKLQSIPERPAQIEQEVPETTQTISLKEVITGIAELNRAFAVRPDYQAVEQQIEQQKTQETSRAEVSATIPPNVVEVIQAPAEVVYEGINKATTESILNIERKNRRFHREQRTVSQESLRHLKKIQNLQEQAIHQSRPSVETIITPSRTEAPIIARPQPEHRQPRPSAPEKITPARAEKLKSPNSPVEPQSIKDILKSRAQSLTPEKLARARYEMVQPEIVQKVVEKAAEVDMPIESQYELRHEVKDNDNVAQQPQSFYANPASFAPSPNSMLPPDLTSTHQQQSFQPKPIKGTSLQDEMYKKAALSGFITALIIIAIVIATTLY